MLNKRTFSLLLGTIIVGCSNNSEVSNPPIETKSEKEDSAPVNSPRPTTPSERKLIGFVNCATGIDIRGLSPLKREKLQTIKMLILKNDNLNDLWSLNESNTDFVLVALEEGGLSTDAANALRDWAIKYKKGVFFTHQSFNIAWSRFFPDDFYFRYNGEGPWIGKNHRPAKPEKYSNHTKYPFPIDISGSLSTNVQALVNYLDCSNLGNFFMINYGATEIFRKPGEISHFFYKTYNEELSFVLVHAREKHKTVLMSSTWKGARIIWYANAINFERDCSSQNDDARLWYNIASWLATGVVE